MAEQDKAYARGKAMTKSLPGSQGSFIARKNMADMNEKAYKMDQIDLATLKARRNRLGRTPGGKIEEAF
jgi:hypothetical protein